ncbi:hypothetical protein [Burkholderia sp. AU31652]|uniref:hypothetical protein n=1 Tax=Burkholderia sp. AU31652 TaxID=2015354 RepID=UPI0011778372|nr:hypothetical protein [Burkholderia sp. AU31652]
MKLFSFAILATLAGVQSSFAGQVETRIFTSQQCPVTSPASTTASPGAFAPIVAALMSAAIAPLVQSVVDKASGLVTEAAKEKDQVLSVPPAIQKQFYQIGIAGDVLVNPAIACLIIVRGTFVNKKPETASHSDDLVLKSILANFNPVDSNDPAVVSTGVWLADNPEFYFETSMIVGDDKKSIAFQPRAIYIGQFAMHNGLFGPRHRNYKIAVTFTDWSNNTAFASTEFDFQGVEQGKGQQDCVGVKIGASCTSSLLGGLHGWFSTKPATDATQAIAKQRANTALSLRQAVVLPADTPPAPPTESAHTVQAHSLYCRELVKANKAKPDAQKVSDDACPLELVNSKQEYMLAKAADQRASDQIAAKSLWNKHCAGKNYESNANGAARCLQGEFFKLPLYAGDILISASITEERPPNAVAAFFAPTVAAVTPKLKDEVVSQLDPVARDARAKEKQTQEQTAATASRQAIVAAEVAKLAVDEAQQNYQQALDSYNKNQDDTKLRIAVIENQSNLLQKKSIANEAARAAGQPVPFDDIY